MTNDDFQEACRLMVLYHGANASGAAKARAHEALSTTGLKDFGDWTRIAKLLNTTWSAPAARTQTS